MSTLPIGPLQGTTSKFARFAPWLLLGPVTGLLTFLCLADLRAGRRIRAVMWIGLGIAFWTLAPMLLGIEVAYIRRAS